MVAIRRIHRRARIAKTVLRTVAFVLAALVLLFAILTVMQWAK